MMYVSILSLDAAELMAVLLLLVNHRKARVLIFLYLKSQRCYFKLTLFFCLFVFSQAYSPLKTALKLL